MDDPFVATLVELETCTAAEAVRTAAQADARVEPKKIQSQPIAPPDIAEKVQALPTTLPDVARADAPTQDKSPGAAVRAPTSTAEPPAGRALRPVAGWSLVSLMFNVVLITVAVVLGVQHILFDPGASDLLARALPCAKHAMAMLAPLGCTLSLAKALRPTVSAVTLWVKSARRPHANTARRASARETSAADNRRPLHRALAHHTPLTAARSDALDRTVHHALRAQLLSALCCLTLAGMYCSWLHGSTLLGIDV
eukprot:4843924-Pleurochrysis_carterae.AAC.7